MKTSFCAAACAAMLLAGCGGGSDHGNAGSEPPPVPPPVTAVDTFFSAVLSVFGKDEDGEPAAVDAAAPTVPEGTEPQAVP